MCRCWTQRIRSLVIFITYLEPLYVLNYNYIVVSLPIGFFVNAYLNGEGVQEFLTRPMRILRGISMCGLLLILTQVLSNDHQLHGHLLHKKEKTSKSHRKDAIPYMFEL